tara:strand:- start:43627 stop:43950 length:324 start_codon:yes stop_codon:yes gene_type:complete
MPVPEHNIDVGTLGPAPCQIALNQILIDLDDPRITKKITSRYHQLREGLNRLKDIRPKGFCITIMRMYYDNHLRYFEKQKDSMPEKAYTHSLCCYKMLLKKAIKSLS